MQARLETPVRRHAYAIAAAAEPVGHGPDETHVALPSRRVVELRDALAAHRRKLRHGREDLVCRDKASPGPVGALPHAHELDEAHGEVAVARKLGQRSQLVVIHAADKHAVNLGVGEACGVGRLEAGKCVRKRAAPRDGLVARGIKRVQAHVKAREPRGTQVASNGREQRGVGSHVHLVDARHRGNHAHKVNNAAPHQGLPTRKAHLAHSQ